MKIASGLDKNTESPLVFIPNIEKLQKSLQKRNHGARRPGCRTEIGGSACTNASGCRYVSSPRLPYEGRQRWELSRAAWVALPHP